MVDLFKMDAGGIDALQNLGIFTPAKLTAEDRQIYAAAVDLSAHGFQVLEAESELLYLHTACYTPTCEGGVCYDDPLIDIHWPLAVTDISDRDQLHPLLDEHYSGVKL